MVGRVVNAFGEPVPGAEVIVVRAEIPELESLAPVQANGRAEAFGRFRIPLPAAGPGFVVAVRAHEFVPTIREHLYVYHDRPTDLDDVDLDPGFFVRGRVVDEHGASVAGARVRVMGSTDHRRAWTALHDAGIEIWPEVQSNATGGFRLGPFGRGAWDLSCAAAGYCPQTIDGRRMHPDESDFRFVLLQGAAVEGLVLDTEGKPVPGATVTLARPPRGAISRQSRADPAGRFVLPGLPDQKQGLLVDASGFVSVRVTDVLPGAEPARIVLHRTATAEGRVQVDPDGVRPDRFRIVACRLDRPEDRATRVKTFTDATRGTFRWEGLEPGLWQFQVHAKGFAFARSEAVQLGSGQATVLPAFQLQPAVCIAGMVVDDVSCRPIAGARVMARDEEGRGLAEARSDALGMFALSGLRRDSYRVTVTDERHTETSFDAVRADDNDVLLCRVPPAGELHGTVFGPADRPWPGARVALESVSAGSSLPIRHVVADDEGRFRVRGLSSGCYSLRLLPDGRMPADAAAGPVVSVEVRAGLSVRVDLNSRMQSELEGTVRRLELPVAGVHVVLTELDTRAGLDRGAWHAWSDVRGEFHVTGLPPGRLQLTALSPGGLRVGEKTLPVVPVSTVRADINLAGGRVVGTVETNITCRPVPGVCIQLQAETDSSHAWIEERYHPGETTDPEGRFEIPHVPPGRYRVRAVKPGFVPVVTAPFTLEQDQLHGPLRIRLNGGATLRGRVRDGRSGEAELDAFLRLLDDAGKPCTDVIPLHVARRGAFWIRGVRPGTYRIEFFRPGYRARATRVTLEPGMNPPVRVTLHAEP